MAFELVELPYDYDALSPYMSRETLEYHHDKHHLAYLTNTNNFVKDLGLGDKNLTDLIKE
ncbi:MAG: superoxide dismutase, partial [Bartonella sp.]|nr:superoxide dismutase [Bartonella sp.]